VPEPLRARRVNRGRWRWWRRGARERCTRQLAAGSQPASEPASKQAGVSQDCCCCCCRDCAAGLGDGVRGQTYSVAAAQEELLAEDEADAEPPGGSVRGEPGVSILESVHID
jgi:hypothetical protein